MVRTSAGCFGLRHRSCETGDGPIVIYDQNIDQFVHYPDLAALLKSDQALASFVYTPPPTDVRKSLYLHGDIVPTVLSDRESIECFSNGTIFRTEFAVPTLKYAAAEALFEARPNLRSEMSAKEFETRTGIGGMQAHFDQ